MTYNEILLRVKNGGLSPDEVAEYRTQLAVKLAYLHEEKARLGIAASEWINAHRPDHKSYADAERGWDVTEEGKSLIKVKERINGMGELLKVLESRWFSLRDEMKQANAY